MASVMNALEGVCMRVAVRMFGFLLVLIASLGKPALAAGPVPSVISPKGPATLLLRPTVTGYRPAPCVEKGAVLTFEGSSFGDTPTGKQAVLAGRDFSLILEGKSWSSKSIAVVVPKDPRIVPGELYVIGIQDGSGKWISNIDKTFRICLPQPTATQPAGSSAAIVKPLTITSIKVPAAAPASAAGAVSGSPTQPSATQAAGSGTLAGTGGKTVAPLPAPPAPAGPSTPTTVVQKPVTPPTTSPSQPAGSEGTTTTAPHAGSQFQPKEVRTDEISLTGTAFSPKAVQTNEISLTGTAFSPKAVQTNEISLTGTAFSPKAVQTNEISITGTAFSPKTVWTDEISLIGTGSQATPAMR